MGVWGVESHPIGEAKSRNVPRGDAPRVSNLVLK